MSEAGGWLEISTAGFASFNSARKAEHLVKELVQNSFDAIGDRESRVHLDYAFINGELVVECRDNGEGMSDLSSIRVVYLTFKKDSHLKRGRFGRGFKEVLSVAKWASVASGSEELRFEVANGKQVTRSTRLAEPITGTVVGMAMPYGPETVEAFDQYFSTFIVPTNIAFHLNGRAVDPRTVRHLVTAQLTTEMYHPESQSWRKPKRATSLELIATREAEEAMIYEMGIPVASAEWSSGFHVNVLQRVPMNPNRDALATGYARSVHAAALPVLLPELEQTTVTADWVGAAGLACDDEVQKQIVAKAFGDNAVRAVPTVGKRDFNDDAERVGSSIVHTAQMSAGFREMAKSHLPTAKQRVDEAQAEMLASVARTSFSLDALGSNADIKAQWIEKRGGRAHVDRCLSFAVWFCQQLVDRCSGVQPRVTGAVAIGSDEVYTGVGFSKFVAHWSDQNTLTLALDCEVFWKAPIGAEALAIYMHEAAHAQNQHHGKGFHSEVERLAGVAASVMFEQANEIRARWPELIAKPTATKLPGSVAQATAAAPATPREVLVEGRAKRGSKWWPFGGGEAEKPAAPSPKKS